MRGDQGSLHSSPKMVQTDNNMSVVVPSVHANQHHTRAVGDRTRQRAVGDHKQESERELLEWLQPFTDGSTEGASNSTDIPLAFPEPIPPPAIPPPVVSSSAVTLQQSWWETQFVHALSEVPYVPGLQAYENYKGALQKKPHNANTFGGLITADHKVLNDCGCPRLNNTMDSELSMQDEGSFRNNENSSKSLRDHSPKSTYKNNSLVLSEACEELNWNHGSLLRSERKKCRTSRTTNTRRYVGRTSSVWSAKNLVGLKHGGSLMSPTHPRPTGRWPDTL